LYTLQ